MQNYNRIKERTIGALYLIPFVLIGALVLYFLQQCGADKQPTESIQQSRDTIVLRDTVRLRPPLQVVRTLHTDTIYVKDTSGIFTPMQQTRAAYAFNADTVTESNDTIKVTANITGVDVELNDLTIDYTHKEIATTTTILQRERKKRWGIGLQLGAGAAMHDKKIIVSPYIGIGISYNLLTF